MIGRRQLILGAVMSIFGRGGMPPRRPDQAAAPPLGWSIGAGSRNVFKGRLVVIFGTSSNGSVGLFVYSGPPALGNLIASIASSNGTDPYGNPYFAGISGYGAIPSGGTAHQRISIRTSGLTAGEVFITGSAAEAVAANIASGLVNPGLGTELMDLIFSGPKGSAVGARDWSQIIFQSNNPNTTSPATGFLMYIDDAQTAHVIAEWGGNGFYIANLAVPATPVLGVNTYSVAGQLKYVSTDTNAYNTGRFTVFAPGSQTIATAPAYTDLTGLTVPVVAGTYHFRAHLWYVDNGVGVASNALFKVQGPAFSLGSYSGTFTGNGPLLSERYDNTSGFNVALTGPAVTPGSGTFFSAVIEGLCTFTGAGNLSLQAACGAAGGARFVIAGGSFLELFPVT